MGTRTLGNTALPTAIGNTTATYNYIASSGAGWQMTETGLVDTLWFAFGGVGANIDDRLVLINGDTGAVLGMTNYATTGQGNAWRGAPLPSPILVTAGTHIFVALWVPSGSTVTFGGYNTGGWQAKSGVGNPPGTMAGAVQPGSPYVQGYCGHYVEYNPVSLYAFDGVGERACTTRVADATGTFQLSVVKVWNGTGGVQVGCREVHMEPDREPQPMVEREEQTQATHIRFLPEHADEARHRLALIQSLQAEGLEHAARAQRAEVLARLASEALTFWLAARYSIHPELGEQWHLDVDAGVLTRVVPLARTE